MGKSAPAKQGVGNINAKKAKRKVVLDPYVFPLVKNKFCHLHHWEWDSDEQLTKCAI